MASSPPDLDNWLNILHDFRPVEKIYVPAYGRSSKYVKIPNPRPAVRNQDPSYLMTSRGDLPDIVQGPNGLIYADSVRLKTLQNSIATVDKIIKKNNINYSKNCIHTYLLATAIELSLKRKRGSSDINFLEIGTYDGINSLIISLISDQVIVHTFDPDPTESATSWKYKDANDQNFEEWGSEHLKKRNANIDRPNIKYYPTSSSSLLNHIKSIQRADVIWVDGDHRFPQIAIDLAGVLAMYRDSIILVDDVYLARSNNATVETIRFLARDLELDVFLHQKKVGLGKFVAIIGNNLPPELTPATQQPISIKYSENPQ